MKCFKCGAENAPDAKFCAGCGMPLVDAAAAVAMTDIKPVKKINPHLYAATLWGGITAIVAGVVLQAAVGGASAILAVIGFVSVMFAIVYSFICIYRAWSLIQGTTARTTAGRAVAFLFIPFFNFYWLFIAHKGLATDANKYLESKGLNHLKISGGLSLAYCICALIPIVNYVSPILFTILVYQWARYINGALDNPEVVAETTAARAAARIQKGKDKGVIIGVVIAVVVGVIFIGGILAAIAIPAFLGQQAKAKQRVMEMDAEMMMQIMEGVNMDCGAYPELGAVGPGPVEHVIELNGVGQCTTGSVPISIQEGMIYEVMLTPDGYAAALHKEGYNKTLYFDNTGKLEWAEEGQ